MTRGVHFDQFAHVASWTCEYLSPLFDQLQRQIDELRLRMSADRLNIETARRMQVVDRMEESIQSVRRSSCSISRLGETMSVSRFAFRPLIDGVLDCVATELEQQNVRVDVDVPPSALVGGDRELIELACRILLQIAVRSMPRGGDVSVSAFAMGAQWEIEIADSSSRQVSREGPMTIPMAMTAKLQGVDAMGIEVVEQIVRRHGGSVSAVNCPQGGIAWTLAFPVVVSRMAA